MRVVYFTSSSLDGYIADQKHDLSWLFSQEHSEPSTPELRIDHLLSKTEAILMGSSTYRWIREQTTAEEWPYTQPTWVLTRAEQEPIAGAEVHFSSGDVGSIIERINETSSNPDGVVWIVGGGDLAGQLADVGLLDEVVITYVPVTLGSGAPLLPRRLQLRLSASEAVGDFITVQYDVVGIRDSTDWTS